MLIYGYWVVIKFVDVDEVLITWASLAQNLTNLNSN